MIALDTSVVVRLIVRDDETQLRLARALLDDNQVTISLLTLLECEWVLRSRYHFDAHRTVDALREVIAFPNVSVEREALALWALERHLGNADLTGMLLLVAAHGSQSFATFDKSIAKGAGKNAPVPVLLLK
jgi:predicted nucleic-acid-binding protein